MLPLLANLDMLNGSVSDIRLSSNFSAAFQLCGKVILLLSLSRLLVKPSLASQLLAEDFCRLFYSIQDEAFSGYASATPLFFWPASVTQSRMKPSQAMLLPLLCWNFSAILAIHAMPAFLAHSLWGAISFCTALVPSSHVFFRSAKLWRCFSAISGFSRSFL